MTNTDDPRVLTTSTNDALGDHDVVGLQSELAAGKVHPQELLAAALGCLDRAADLNATVARIDPESELRNLLVGSSGAFAGIPSYVKDNEDVTGLPTTQGSRAVKPTPAMGDSWLVQRFRELGFRFWLKPRCPISA